MENDNMFERFNEKARRVIFFARYEASKRRQPVVTPEDILLGVLREVMFVLRSEYRVVDPLYLIGTIQDMLPTSDVKQEGIYLPLTSEAKLCIEEATAKAKIEVTPRFLLWVIYPSLNPQVVGILEAHGITRDSLTEKKLV